ncbi:MAG: PQQ-binding-like beta-propeller repeat protein, partial [Bacillota bacterium]
GYVFGIDRESGAEKWRFRAGLSVTSSVAVAGGRAVVAAYDGRICSLSLGDGQLLWDFVVPGDLISGSPAVGGGSVFVPALGTGEGGGAVYALDEATGAVRWKTPLQGWLGNSVAFGGGKVVVAATGFKTGGVYALDAGSGTLLWGPVRSANNQWSSPAISSDTIYLGNTGWLYAIDLDSGQFRWQWKAPAVTRKSKNRTYQHDALVRPPVISGGRLYASTYFEVPGPDAIYVLSAATGKELWKNEIPWRVGSGPVGGRGGLVIGGTAGEMEAWSPVALTVNGETVQFEDIGPVIVEERTWAPCRARFGSAGVWVEWDGRSWSVSCTKDGVSVVMAVDSPAALVNGREVPMGAPLRIMCDRVMIQLATVVAALGGGIEWDPVKYNVHVRLNEDRKSE